MARKVSKQPRPETVEADNFIETAARAASDKKATDIVALDLREVASFTDYFLLCTGGNARQVAAIAEAIEDELRKSGRRPLHTEGYANAEWVLLDYGDFIVHVFQSATRRFYDLERLWRDAKRIEFDNEEVKR
ncbi:MAG: ribosome silencing factor [Acidobacteriota bacterium]